MKKILSFITLLIIMLTLSYSAIAETKDTNSYVIYINGTKSTIPSFKQSPSNLVFVSEDLITKMGDKVVKQGNSIVVKKGNKQLKFQNGKTVYWVNGKSKSLATKKVKGKTVPVYAIVKSIGGKLYIPLSVLQNEFGYPVKMSGNTIYVGKLPTPNTNTTNTNTGHKLTGNNPIYDYWVQHPVTLNDVKQYDVKTTPKMFFPKLGTPSEDNDIRVFENNRGFKSGWVMPVLPSNTFATDNWEKDRETLKKYLEMGDFNSWGGAIKYSPSGKNAGWETMVLGVENKPAVDYIIWFRYYWYPFYNEMTAFENQKINWIHPQVLRFYFPTKWQEIWENAIGRSQTIYVGRIYVFDGREFMVDKNDGCFYFSKKGGKLDRNDEYVKRGLE